MGRANFKEFWMVGTSLESKNGVPIAIIEACSRYQWECHSMPDVIIGHIREVAAILSKIPEHSKTFMLPDNDTKISLEAKFIYNGREITFKGDPRVSEGNLQCYQVVSDLSEAMDYLYPVNTFFRNILLTRRWSRCVQLEVGQQSPEVISLSIDTKAPFALTPAGIGPMGVPQDAVLIQSCLELLYLEEKAIIDQILKQGGAKNQSYVYSCEGKGLTFTERGGIQEFDEVIAEQTIRAGRRRSCIVIAAEAYNDIVTKIALPMGEITFGKKLDLRYSPTKVPAFIWTESDVSDYVTLVSSEFLPDGVAILGSFGTIARQPVFMAVRTQDYTEVNDGTTSTFQTSFAVKLLYPECVALMANVRVAR